MVEATLTNNIEGGVFLILHTYFLLLYIRMRYSVGHFIQTPVDPRNSFKLWATKIIDQYIGLFLYCIPPQYKKRPKCWSTKTMNTQKHKMCSNRLWLSITLSPKWLICLWNLHSAYSNKPCTTSFSNLCHVIHENVTDVIHENNVGIDNFRLSTPVRKIIRIWIN